MAGDTVMDFHMLLESKGAVIEGDGQRKFEDGKMRLPVGGYYNYAHVVTPPGSSKGQVRTTMFIVVRDSDAATASIASLLKTQAADITATISVFKASGDGSVEQQAMLEFVLSEARIDTHAFVTGGVPKRPREIIYFNYRKIEIRSAAQASTGLRGAVRTCVMTAP
jgi:type VI protein secretion system component Hcp